MKTGLMTRPCQGCSSLFVCLFGNWDEARVSLTKTRGFVERKTMEPVAQATTSTSINRRVDGAGTVGNLYL